MPFDSPRFALFFVVVLLLHATLAQRKRARHAFLLAASYLFYAAWNEKLIVLILLSTALDFWAGGALHRARSIRRRRLLLAVSLTGNLGLLGLFKYFDFFAVSFVSLLQGVGVETSLPTLRLVLPIGISFYTFQTLSYTVAIYRRQLEPTRSFLHFALFVAFFPQLVAGPIVRAGEFLPQLESEPERTPPPAPHGLFRLLRGLSKKLLLANPLAIGLVDPVFAAPDRFGAPAVLLAVFAFRFQIYLDFSGYSDIAIGCARMLGFELPENFRSPYRAASTREYWRRWHITMGTWFRDHVYRPLVAGSVISASLALWVTLGLVGLWHGARWTFVIWGLYYAALLFGERFLADRGVGRSLGRPVKVALTFGLGMVAAAIFRSTGVDPLLRLFAALGRPAGESLAVSWELGGVLAIAVISHFLPSSVANRAQRQFDRLPVPLQAAACVGLAVAVVQAVGANPAFYYFQF